MRYSEEVKKIRNLLKGRLMKDPSLVRRISEKTGLGVLTITGLLFDDRPIRGLTLRKIQQFFDSETDEALMTSDKIEKQNH